VAEPRQGLLGDGWIVVFLAICNSIAANSNAAVNAATRVFYSLSRNGLAPQALGKTHARFRTPHVAIIWMTLWAVVLSLLVAGSGIPAPASASSRTRRRRSSSSSTCSCASGACLWYLPATSRLQPAAAPSAPARRNRALLLPLYYQFVKVPPPYPFKYANWIAIGWVALGVALTFIVVASRRNASLMSTASTSTTRR